MSIFHLFILISLSIFYTYYILNQFNFFFFIIATSDSLRNDNMKKLKNKFLNVPSTINLLTCSKCIFKHEIIRVLCPVVALELLP